MNLWQGLWLDDEATEARLARLAEDVQAALAEALPTSVVLAACEALSADLLGAGPAHGRLASYLCETGMPASEAAATLAEIGAFLGRDALATKLVRELGTTSPERLSRRDFKTTVFEAWAPLGLLVHIAPGNAAGVGALSVVEGLLTGNLNVVKTSGGDTLLTQKLLFELGAKDESGAVARRIVALRFESSRTAWLERLCSLADGVAAWGGEEALAGIARHVRAGCRLIDWGPKISFAYLTRDTWSEPEALAALARELCRLDQQACASPQVAYLDTADPAEAFAFGERLAAVLDEVARGHRMPVPSLAEQAEITNTVVVTRLEEHLGLTKVHGAADGPWRILVDTRPALRASPLYRTLWVKPLPRRELVATLRPMRRYLQTMGLACSRPDAAELTRLGLRAGVLRVTTLGGMLGSYAGEPHDGVYALPRYARRVSVQLDERFAHDAALDDLLPAPELAPPRGAPVLTKADFQAQAIEPRHAELYFKSGGSSGEPKLSVFTYADYHDQMRRAAEGLLAAGLDPGRDRAMNLFFGGGLYGGFVSFFTVLEALEVVQLPMAAHADHRMVAETIARHGVDTLLGMPSYILQVFAAGGDVLRQYRGVKKIFFGGEHFGEPQRRALREEFGVETIRSAVYGSVDAGPLGYQCEHATGSIHHLLTGLQTLEILAPDADRPVEKGEAGRLVFTSHVRRGQHLARYEIGDLGHWVEGVCPCGRQTPRFALLGRFGDVFRIAGSFFNYQRLSAAAAQSCAYGGQLQVVLEDGEERGRLIVRVEPHVAADELRSALLASYPDLHETVVSDGLLELVVETVELARLERTPGSGKLRNVVDRRIRGARP